MTTPQGTQGHQGSRRAQAPSGPSRLALRLSVGVPLLVLLGSLIVSGAPTPPPAATPPAEASLTRAQLPCPEAAGGRIGLGSVSKGAAGRVELHLGGEEGRSAKVTAGRVAWVGEADATVVDGRLALAPGLIATRLDERRGAAVSCHEPRPDTWFTGVGAASIHSSKLQLINPDSGLAVVDISVFGERGPLESDDLRGISVPGGTATTIDLSQTVPTRSELAVHVRVSRGRLGVYLLDSFNERTSTRDWLAPQAEPAVSTTIVGIPTGAGERTLVVANPGDDEARVLVRVIGASSTFTPAGYEEISIAPHSVVRRNLDSVFASTKENDSFGLLITSSVPVTASARTLRDAELTSASGLPLFTRAGLVLPDGEARLQVAAPDLAGSADVTSYDERGKVLSTERIAAQKLTGARLELPDRTAFVTVTSATGLYGVVRIATRNGLVTLPLTDAVFSGLTPAVRAVP